MIRRNFLASAVDATLAPLAAPSLAHIPYRRAAADAVRWKKVADFARIRLD
ncbi:hypothetical protein [Variovorax ginsengisoli]|uniref:Uncharacterized protein n=1 Tax=Variovorax ginsengisoli TaxID=363844 RepID=A0ABT9S7B3_9BURK|nr:hypothetical protein [Variovorax ginsengisoli]MDP9900249.1 hypothetical protein [Variovorax ginsengisoli]